MNKKLILINLLLHVLLSLSFASKLERFSGTSLYQARFDYVLVDDSLVETLKTIIAANEITRDKVIILSRHSDVFLTLKIDDIALVGIIEEYLRQVDFVRGSNLSTTIYLQYTSAVSMATHLHKIFGLSQETVMPNSKVGMTISYTSGIRIVPDEETNSIIIDGPAPAVEKAREIIQSLDSRIPQVLIEVLISEITLNEDSSIGLELDFTGQNSGHHNLNSQVTLDHGSMGNTNSHINTLNNLRGLKATLLNPGNFEAFLQNVQQNNKIKVISRPKILTANNKAANFSATQKTPILKTTNADGVVNNSVDYIDIGVELKVLPRINTDDYINLDITQTIQEVIGTDATALNSPIYSDRVV